MDMAIRDDVATPLRELIRAEFSGLIRAEFGGMFEEMRRFVDRRIAELSMEVSAAVQLVDYSEANLSGQLTRMHDQIAGLLAAPANATRNSGLELETVVQATEAAASQIMEAAEAISDWLRGGSRDAESLHSVEVRIASIFEACSFQDLTGQRIRRAIANLQHVETVLGGMIEPGAAPPPPPEPSAHLPAGDGPDLAQQEIDRLLNG